MKRLITCEACGKGGEMRLGTWYVTQCDRCYSGREIEGEADGETNDKEKCEEA